MKTHNYLLLIMSFVFCQNEIFSQEKNYPTSTQLTISKAGEFNNSSEVENVCLVYDSATNSKGSGFVIKSGYVITNFHVIGNSDRMDIHIRFPNGKVTQPLKVFRDSLLDLAAMQIIGDIPPGFELGSSSDIMIGNQVYSWGFPEGYNGPAPLLTVGYISGLNNILDENGNKQVEHLVVNAAFNSGNSGGGLVSNGKIVGVVQSKHAPISKLQLSIIEALKANNNGLQYSGYDENGKPKSYSEGQLVAEMLVYFRNLTQLMIGEAVEVKELKKFLNNNEIQY